MTPRLLRSRDRARARSFAGGLVVTLAALAYFLIQHGHRREYLFEIAVISIVWLTLIRRRELAALRGSSRENTA